MKLLLDQGMPRLTAQLLRLRGYEAVHASEIGMQLAQDIEYLLRAAADGSVVATLDADFHRDLALRAMTMPSTIHLRLHNPDENLAASVLDDLCRRFPEQLKAGFAITFKRGKARLRPLPIKK